MGCSLVQNEMGRKYLQKSTWRYVATRTDRLPLNHSSWKFCSTTHKRKRLRPHLTSSRVMHTELHLVQVWLTLPGNALPCHRIALSSSGRRPRSALDTRSQRKASACILTGARCAWQSPIRICKGKPPAADPGGGAASCGTASTVSACCFAIRKV